MSVPDWRRLYDDLARRLPDLARAARPTLCGFGACVDVYIPLHETRPLLEAASGTPAAALARELLDRAARGIGGEIRIDWPEGSAWLDSRLPQRLGLGGTGAQAAQTLAVLGAPAILALGHRSRRQLELIHPAVRVAADERIIPAIVAIANGGGKPAHYIVEFTAGVPIGTVVPPRSSRIIIRFADDPLERDPWFEQASLDLAAGAGAAIVSGFNEVSEAELAPSLTWVAALARSWREAGLRWVHLELGDFEHPSGMVTVLEGLEGAVSSLGLSLAELDKLLPRGPVAERARELALRFGFDRVAVHADGWALAVTQDDAEREFDALMAGSLVAATRAWQGRIVAPDACPPGVAFAEPPAPPLGHSGGWSVACCAAPYLSRPSATIGLGDTFLAGTLLILGQPGIHRPAATLSEKAFP